MILTKRVVFDYNLTCEEGQVFTIDMQDTKDLESKSIIKNENEEEYPYPGDFYEENNANCDMNYEENEMEPWSSELGNIGDENAMNDD